MLKIYKVSGNSMRPYLVADDFVVVSCLFVSIKPGDSIVASHPCYKRIIKRVDQICPHRGYWLSGENQESVSSDRIGWINKKQVVGKVIFKIRQPSY